MNTIHLALISLLVERDDVDAGNAVQLLQNAETNVLWTLLEDDFLSPADRQHWLNAPMDEGRIDNLLIHASQNGAKDIFKA